ncbi:MAG: helix-turn-helix transcriptional regulator, partial [Deltaproteobacteria bacterium]
RDADKTEIEEKVLFNIKELVLPYVQELEKTRLDAKQKAYLNVLQANLNSIISPFTYRLSSQYQGLTPTEIRIASLVKEGQTAKEIAEMLNVSVRTIEFHKKGIRRKLNLRNRKVNLRAHLLSMSY